MTSLAPLRGEARVRLLQALDRVAAFVSRIGEMWAGELACRPGCDGCCRQILSLRGVEAAYLLEGARALPPEKLSLVWASLADAGEDAPCPLLQGGACAVYDHRPVVCRTHGLPMLRREGEGAVLHCCPENFRAVDLSRLPPAFLLDEGRLSLLMDAVDAIYCAGGGRDAPRYPVDQLLRAGLQN